MYLYQSNRLENLFSLLCNTLARPLADPLTTEIIVVQNPGMARWLSHHIAQATGIAANLDFPLPASFIWRIFEYTLSELPDLSNFNKEILLWRILSELKELSRDPSMIEIEKYLENDNDGVKTFQLAGMISDLFDQYQVFRPDILLNWEKSTGREQSGKNTSSTRKNQQGQSIAGWPENHLQAQLWRKLTKNHPLHRASLLQKFFERNSKGQLHTASLPERISLFGINTLAPAYLSVIEQISRFTEVHFFHLSPCRQAWDDILPERLLTIKRKSWRGTELNDIIGYFTSGNPLLASMGMVGREFFNLLLQYNPIETEFYEDPQQDSLLSAVQADILDLRDRTRTPTQDFNPADTSITFHSCHSPMREIQVLHDRLLDCFTADPDLKPADILVMAPDINHYTPCITGVFGAAEDGLRIPFSIADRCPSGEDMVIDGFLALLALATSRCSAPEIVALLENRAIGKKFLISEDDIPSLRERVAGAGIRWGLDQAQRQTRDLDDSNLHTWEFGLLRLLLGHVTGPLEKCWQDIMPSATTAGSTGSWLGGLAGFIRGLQSLLPELRRDHAPKRWSELLLQLIDNFFTADRDEHADSIRLLRETIRDFSTFTRQANFAGPLSITVIHSYFKQRFNAPGGGQPFLAGRVTFCNMVPMRSVPFKVIWLLGMNDTDYPRSQHPPAFDLIARKPRLGDRNRRDDDRYLFLEALLSARRHLFISWIGRDLRENTDLPPSVVVAELRDYINRGWPVNGTAGASELLTTQHPLQPFSRHCFDGNPKTAGYAGLWLPTILKQKGERFLNNPLLKLKQQEIELGQLVRFWNHPVRFFLEQRLGLRLNLSDELLPESEPFTLDPLTGYHLSGTLLTRILAGQDPLPICRQAEAAALLPRGEIGRIHCRQMLATAVTLAGKIQQLAKAPSEPVEFTIPVAGINITGRLDSLYGCGRISLRPATCKAKDLLQLWIHHLILCRIRPGGIDPVSTHLGTDATLTLKPVDNPRAELKTLSEYFLQGMSEPLHFYPEISYALATAKTESSGIKNAYRRWYSGYRPGEEEDSAYGIALRGQNPLDEQFLELTAIFHPILAVMEREDAAS